MSKVEFLEINKSFGKEVALRDFSLEVQDGSLLTMLGPSGCGKTTALRILAGFETPDSGTILVDGKQVQALGAKERGFGMVFQAYSLFPNLTAGENVQFPLQIRKWDKRQTRRRLNELFELIGMTEHIDKYPHQLSGGQQQRVALARALATEPKVLLLDEPLSALDATVREQLRQEIRNLQQQSGVTTIFVTHDQHEALAISDRVAVMRAGAIEQIDTPDAIYSSPVNEFVAKFVGTVNEIPLTSSGNGIWAWRKQKFSGPVGFETGKLFIRPEQLEISTGSDFRVTSKTFQGSFTRLSLEGELSGLLVDIPSVRAVEISINQELSIKASAHNLLITPSNQG